MSCTYNPYTLPTIDFVGGETQDLAFNVYFYRDKKPFSLTGCDCNFSIVSFTNKTGTPILTKQMESIFNNEGTYDNVLTVTLSPPKRLTYPASIFIKSSFVILMAMWKYQSRVSYTSQTTSIKTLYGNDKAG